jgi:predicted nucleic acid-binding protein
MIVADTSAVFSALDRSQPAHDAVVEVLEDSEPLVLSPFVLAELDYLLATRISVAASVELLRDVADGAYELAPFSPDEVGEAATLVGRYESLGIGLADASLVILADRYDTDRVLTLDERHFRALRTRSGNPFTLLPADR